MTFDNIVNSVLIAGFAAAAIIGVTVSSGYKSSEDYRQEAMDATVQIENFCSGTVVEDPDPSDGIQPFVITAKHCVKGHYGIGDGIHVRIPAVVQNIEGEYKSYDAIVWNISDESDLTYLKVVDEKFPDITPLKIYKGLTKFGDHVWTIGYPSALTKSMVDGYLGWIKKIPYFNDVSKDGWYQYAPMLVSPGSSGSSLLIETDDGYEVIGVLTGGLIVVALGYQVFWVPQEEIIEFQNEGGFTPAP